MLGKIIIFNNSRSGFQRHQKTCYSKAKQREPTHSKIWWPGSCISQHGGFFSSSSISQLPAWESPQSAEKLFKWRLFCWFFQTSQSFIQQQCCQFDRRETKTHHKTNNSAAASLFKPTFYHWNRTKSEKYLPVAQSRHCFKQISHFQWN